MQKAEEQVSWSSFHLISRVYILIYKVKANVA